MLDEQAARKRRACCIEPQRPELKTCICLKLVSPFDKALARERAGSSKYENFLDVNMAWHQVRGP